MREIRFRAWNEHTKRMHHFDIKSMASSSPYFPGWWYCIDKDCELNIDQADISELMQFTGLLDKSGVEIYEGDILRANWGTGNVNVVVIYEDGAFVLTLPNDPDYRDMAGEENNDFMEVIGNIYEKGVDNADNKL